MTLTIEVPDVMETRLRSLSADQVNAARTAALEAFARVIEAASASSLTDEDIAAIREGLAESEAGRVHDGETVLAELRHG